MFTRETREVLRRGVVQPDDFIPLLEETGLICEVGAWVLHEACRQGAAWRRSGYPVGMAVNVSARQLDTDEIVELGELRDYLAVLVEMAYQATGYRRIKNPRIWSMHDLRVLVGGGR